MSNNMSCKRLHVIGVLLLVWSAVIIILDVYGTGVATESLQNKAFWFDGIAPPQKVVKNNVLCFIMAKGDFQEQGMNSMYGWGHKCNKTLFMTSSSSSFTNATLKRNYTVLTDAFPNTQVVPLDFFNETEDTHDNVGHKAWRSFHYILHNFPSIGDYDYVMKVDLDTYLMMDHYFLYLATLNPNDPLYFGRRFKESGNEALSFVAGASMTVSSATLRQMKNSTEFRVESLEQAIQQDGSPCSYSMWVGHADDVLLAHCLRTIGIFPLDTRDEEGKERFMAIDPELMADLSQNNESWWYHEYSYNKWFGPKCCSRHAICFHYIETEKVKSGVLEYVNEVWRWNATTHR
jgi:hypothetical protein